MARKRIVEHAPRAGAAPERVMLVGKINRATPRGETYPLFQRAAAVLRHRGESVLDPSDEARSWSNDVPYREHVIHSQEMARRADALIVLPRGLDGRLCALLVEWAVMVGVPVLQMGVSGSVTMTEWGDPEATPLWVSRLVMPGSKEDRIE